MFAWIFLPLGFVVGLCMTPKVLTNFFKSIFNKLKMPKVSRKPATIALTEEDKIKWQTLMENCEDDPLIDDESHPAFFEETNPVLEFEFDFEILDETE